MAHHDIDAPVIISDYINVGHAFFDRGETKLINGLLDKVAKKMR
jgi:N utilization substance protein B